MKRGGPLQRKTQLAAKKPLARVTPLNSRSQLQPGQPLARTGRLPARSKKREAEMVERRRMVADFLAEHPRCQARLAGCTRTAVDVHERLSRARGGSILDRSIFVALCRACHTYITEHPAWAEAEGWALPSWWKGETA